jgi:phosphatidylserine synthase
MYPEESLLIAAALSLSRKTITINALEAAAVAIASKGENRRERAMAAMSDGVAADDADDAAARSMPQAGAMMSIVTRLLLALTGG